MLLSVHPRRFACGSWQHVQVVHSFCHKAEDKNSPVQRNVSASQNLPQNGTSTGATKAVKRKPLIFPKLEYEWPFPDFRDPHQIWRLNSAISCFVVGWWGKWVLTRLNKVTINNLNVLSEAIFRRPQGIPLITVANHESCLDDPCLIGALMSNRELLLQSKMRWGVAAHDVCFQKKWHGWLISHGKCAPIVRGMGVHQKGVDFSIQRLNEGHWFHIFPEGRVNMERQSLYRLKWGIGRIISELKVNPLVIPFWHVGMHNVLPNWRPYYPRRGKKVFINIGQPIDLTQVLQEVKECNALEKRKRITDVIQESMAKLREETLALAHAKGITTISDEPEQVDDGK